MPSPLHGLIIPAASPVRRKPGPCGGHTLPPMNRRPARGFEQTVSLLISHSARQRRDEVVLQIVKVDVAPATEGRQQPDADVHGPVADREDPSVAGQRFSDRSGRRGRPRTNRSAPSANGSTAGSRIPSGSRGSRPAQRARELRRGPLGTDDPLGADLFRRHRHAWRRTPRATPLSKIGSDRLRLVEDLGARRFGVVEDDLVEVLARLDEAVVGPASSSGKRAPACGPPRGRAGPLTLSQVRSSSPRPISSRTLTARGVRPSPQVFSRGNAFFSQTRTEWPRVAR